MGLAASQARFLAITARKMNCEFQSMQIAQQKLSVTRDLQKAAQDYQNSLDATKLVWDPDGVQDGDTYELSHDIMMTPSVLNEYSPYLVTNTQGKILLSKQMFEAAKSAGIIDANGDPTNNPAKAGTFAGSQGAYTNGSQLDGSRNAFLYQLTQKNAINGEVYADIIKLGPNGYTKTGAGGPVFDKSMASAMTTNAFINYMQTMTYGEAAKVQGIEKPSDVKDTDKIYSLKLVTKSSSGYTSDIKYDSSNNLTFANATTVLDKEGADQGNYKFTIMKSGATLSENQIESLTVGDLLSGKYEFIFRTTNAGGGDQKSAENIYNNVLDSIVKIFGYDKNNPVSLQGLDIDTESHAALSEALELTKLNATITNIGKTNWNSLADKSKTQNNIIANNDLSSYSFSLTNMVKSFLTNFAIALDGYDSDYNVEVESAKKSDYVTDDPTYYFLLKKDSAMTDKAMLNADFYNALYNQIVQNGAVCDDNMMNLYTLDRTNLQQAVKNGTLFISSLHNDGYYYQGPYTLSGHVAEVKDEDAIARAELEYNVQKSKLNSKEESLDIQMKNLDMEIASLTTEFDTVKNLISKNIEKVFTMFST